MAENSGIEWTTHTFNPWRGCTKISPGCTNCYAETLSGRNPKTLGMWGPKGSRVVAAEAQWRLPLKWNKAAAKAGVRHRVFCASLADVFEDWTGPMVDSEGYRLNKLIGAGSIPWIGGSDRERPANVTMGYVRTRLFQLILDTPNLDWLLLTKRPENAARMMGPDGVGLYAHANGPVPCPQPNIWLGVSVENQAAADERIPVLLQTPAAVRFLSVEPLLGPVDLRFSRYDARERRMFDGREWQDERDVMIAPGMSFQKWGEAHPNVDWVIVGGESGPGARPCDVVWVRDIVRQCQSASVPVFVKQLGAEPIDTRTKDGFPYGWPDGTTFLHRKFRTARDGVSLKDRKGGDMAEFPADLRVREFPTPAAAPSAPEPAPA